MANYAQRIVNGAPVTFLDLDAAATRFGVDHGKLEALLKDSPVHEENGTLYWSVAEVQRVIATNTPDTEA